MQPAILIITLALMALVTLAFWLVIARSGSGKAPSSGKLEGARALLIGGLALFSGVICYFTLISWPHAATSHGDPVTVTATGAQWYWELSADSVPVNKPVVFAVTSKDVNHGFGVYDEDGTILFQTQAMPGYVNKVAYTFTRPGTYRVLCMEYCAGAHHDMMAEFKVSAE